MPGAGGFADRGSEDAGRQLRRSATQSNVFARSVLPEVDDRRVDDDAADSEHRRPDRDDGYHS